MNIFHTTNTEVFMECLFGHGQQHAEHVKSFRWHRYMVDECRYPEYLAGVAKRQVAKVAA
jgi:hypothetical protein